MVNEQLGDAQTQLVALDTEVNNPLRDYLLYFAIGLGLVGIALGATKRGRVVIRIDGFQRTTGRVTTASIRQGGNKVVQKGTTRIPSSPVRYS